MQDAVFGFMSPNEDSGIKHHLSADSQDFDFFSEGISVDPPRSLEVFC